LDEIFNESYELFDRLSKVFVTLALMACFISVVGLFGTAAQAAESRRQEIGIRKTLGATVRQIVEMLLRDFGKPVVIANAIAWPIGFLIVNVYLSVFMHRIPVTPLPFVATLIITTGIAWATVASQSVRAARVRPADVLRSE
jgi:putative ABC transport system permease protein